MAIKGEQGGSHQALYRKYRSRSFAEVVSQSQVTDILQRSIKQGRVAHAYLLTGPKGVGKTSIARIMAHEINQLPYDGEDNHLDIIEIDAASNNGVEDVRDLRDKVQLAPIAASKKVYIIDEVHMLSKPAFNALLKTLEEPPEHVVFILATTDLHKVPATIISRTQHFGLHAISNKDLAGQLNKIAEAEKMKVSDEALDAIAARGDGSFRNSISLLDQLSSFADAEEGITLDLVQTTLGLAPKEAVDTLLLAIADRDVAAVIAQLDTLERQGIQPVILADQVIGALRAQLADQPQSVSLLDALLSVSSSPQPQLKLLTTLVGAIKPKATAAAQTATAARQAVEAPVQLVVAPEKPEIAETKQSASAPAAKPKLAAAKPAKETIVKPKGSSKDNPLELDWAALVKYTKENLVALHSVLAKCTFKLEGDKLTLYTGRKFNKTKLDEARYLTQLHEALSHIGFHELTIETLPMSEPPADEQLAKIAAMMGGGKEVSLDGDI